VSDHVLGVLGGGLIDPTTPLLRADDLGVLRGDAVFETIRLHEGRLDALDAHLGRLVRSAAALGLPDPDLTAWRALVDEVVAGWGERGEAMLRLVLTRGVEGGPPTAFALIAPVPGSTLAARRDGVRVVTLSRGVSSTAHDDSPWLLGGAKTTSYAVNMAAQRYAQALGSDDVIFVSTDGLVLEAPTATVVWAVGETLHTPPTTVGILDGTTVHTLFDHAGAHGFATAVTTTTVAGLHAADAVWLVSSVRGAVAVTAIDGTERGDGGLTARVQSAAGLKAGK
jgi:4-amino-4-deoxychorismate lyase